MYAYVVQQIMNHVDEIFDPLCFGGDVLFYRCIGVLAEKIEYFQFYPIRSLWSMCEKLKTIKFLQQL